MELVLILGLIIIFSVMSAIFKLVGFGFRIFWALLVTAFSLLGYLFIGILSISFPIIAIVILLALFHRKD